MNSKKIVISISPQIFSGLRWSRYYIIAWLTQFLYVARKTKKYRIQKKAKKNNPKIAN
jgi:hypothetical protein